MSAGTAAEAVRHGDVLISVARGVVTAVIDRPDKRNAINYAVIEGLTAAIATTVESGASVLVLRGAGGNFCAGADLNYVQSTLHDGAGLEAYVTRLSEVCDQLAGGPFVSMAAVDGYALAGGCELLLACDLAVASDDARIGDRHLANSLLPGAGGSVRLIHALPPARARYLLYTAEMISGTEAERWGLVSAVVPAGDLHEHVGALAQSIAAKAPEALRAVKAMTVAAEQLPMPAALLEERRIFVGYATENDTVRDALSRFLNRSGGATANSGGSA